MVEAGQQLDAALVDSALLQETASVLSQCGLPERWIEDCCTAALLGCACFMAQPRATAALLEAGASCTAATLHYCPAPLHWALMPAPGRERDSVVEMLLAAGADPFQPWHTGARESILAEASKVPRLLLRRLMQQHMSGNGSWNGGSWWGQRGQLCGPVLSRSTAACGSRRQWPLRGAFLSLTVTAS